MQRFDGRLVGRVGDGRAWISDGSRMDMKKRSHPLVNFRESKRGWSQLNRSTLERKTVASGARCEVK